MKSYETRTTRDLLQVSQEYRNCSLSVRLTLETVEKVSGNDAGDPNEDVLIGSFPLFYLALYSVITFAHALRAFTRHSLLAKGYVAPGTAHAVLSSGQ